MAFNLTNYYLLCRWCCHPLDSIQFDFYFLLSRSLSLTIKFHLACFVSTDWTNNLSLTQMYLFKTVFKPISGLLVHLSWYIYSQSSCTVITSGIWKKLLYQVNEILLETAHWKQREFPTCQRDCNYSILIQKYMVLFPHNQHIKIYQWDKVGLVHIFLCSAEWSQSVSQGWSLMRA